MLGNSALSVDLHSLLPAEESEKWWQESKPKQGQVLSLAPSQANLRGIAELLDFSTVEMSGAIGRNWLCLVSGETLRSPCLAKHRLTWHTHPDGDCRFSVQDWLTFLLSDSVTTCLFTKNAVSVLVKGKDARRDELASVLRAQHCEHRHLARQRDVRAVSDMLGFSIADGSDQQIAVGFGIWYRIMRYD